jgi:hypothetical protein
MRQPTTLPLSPYDIFNVMNHVFGSGHGLTRYCPGICLEGQKKPQKTSLKIFDVLAEVRTDRHPNTSQNLTPNPHRLGIFCINFYDEQIG